MAPMIEVNTGCDGRKFETGMFCPLDQRLSDSVHGNRSIVTFVVALFAWSRPLDITNFIVTVIIDSIKSMASRRLSPNFGEKLSEGLKAKQDTPATITHIFRIVGIVATAFCRMERNVLRRWFLFQGFAVRHINSVHTTTAGVTNAASKALAVNRALSAAVASTKPNNATVDCFAHRAEHEPLEKPFISKVYAVFRKNEHCTILT